MREYKSRFIRAAVVVQKGVKRWQAYRITRQLRAARDAADARQIAATKIESLFRGHQGRKRHNQHKQAWLASEREHRAAVKLQALVRRKQAEKRVNIIRDLKLQEQNNAASVIRKNWLRFLYRRRFVQLRQEFRSHVTSIVAMQRYVRGYLVRLKMWRDAIRCEEELWAAVEIQRCWRGYLGRVRWELEYDSVHSRLVAAMRLQRHVRGWLARSRTHRIRKRMARAEFNRARQRFKAAQKLQALARGVQCRRRIRAFRQRKLDAVVRIQSVWRGHRTRCQLWENAVGKSTVQIQSAIRGFLVRNRRYYLLIKVICIQRNYRRWLRFIPENERKRRHARRFKRREEAKALAAGTA